MNTSIELQKEYKKCEKEYFDLIEKYPWWNPHTNRSNPLPEKIKRKYRIINNKLIDLKSDIEDNKSVQ